ncbi:VOC family protein [Methanoculleus frigidifontis]|nr:VOC family protein [Methanoculleus sp. FWC-SCC1]
MPAITWFDIPADDTGRARAFYEKLFSWEIEPFPGVSREDFWMVSTGRDAIGGDLYRRESAEQHMAIFIDVPNAEEYAQRAAQLGGTVVGEKTAVAGRGYYIICEDTEKNRFGLWESDPAAR